jgi:glucokinase
MTNQPISPIEQCVPPFFVGVDVGGTNMKIGLVDDVGHTFGFKSIPTEEPKGPEDAMTRAAATTRELIQSLGLQPRQFVRVGLGTPGSMDIPKGLLVEPPNHPHWWNFPIRDCLAGKLGLPVSFANDANAAAAGEYWVGTGKIDRSMALLTLGTGVGGGIICDDHLINGENSFGSECGHIIVDSRSDARLCVWGGGKGHLEAYSSASAVAARAGELVGSHPDSPLAAVEGEITTLDVFNAAEQSDALALELIDYAADYLGIGIATLVHCVDPGMVVLGGAMDFGGHEHASGRRFLEKIRASFHERTFDYVFAGTKLDFAVLGGDAGYLGAAAIARQDHLATESNG